VSGAPATISPPPRRAGSRALVRAVRPRQWIKNGLVLAVPAAAGVLFDSEVLRSTTLALLAFCLASAGTYLVNDVADRDADRLHPVKRTRPIAAGEVSARTATIAAIGAFALACGVALPAGVALLLVVVAYIGLTTAYSYGLKRVAIFDLAAVAAGFFLRAVGGGAASDIHISKWFLILAGGGSLFLATAKRYPELRAGGDARPVLEDLRAGMRAGRNVRGAMNGRTVLYPGTDDPRAVAAATAAIIHDGADVSVALEAMDAERGQASQLV
jgi:decaprenyl-phosphate phosphoribosyltransferase